MHCTSPGNVQRTAATSATAMANGSGSIKTTMVPGVVKDIMSNGEGISTIDGGLIKNEVESGVASIDVDQKIYDDPCDLLSTPDWPSPIHNHHQQEHQPMTRSRSWLCCPNNGGGGTAEWEQSPKLQRQFSCQYSLVTEEPKRKYSTVGLGLSVCLWPSVCCGCYCDDGSYSVFCLYFLALTLFTCRPS